MADYGITEYGFVRKPFQTIYTDTVTSFKNRLGNDFDVSDGSVQQQFIGTFCDGLDLSWQAAQGVYSSQTVQGAEGVFLDDLLSQQGVFRQGKTAGGGSVVVFSNLATTTIGQTIPTTSAVTASNNILYRVQDQIIIDSFGSCYTLAASQLVTGTTYTFRMYNIDSPVTSVFTWTPSSDADKDNMLVALSQYLSNAVVGTDYNSYYNSTTRICYVGFNPNNNLPSPLANGKLYANITPAVGNIGNTISVVATTKGYYPLAATGVIGLTPTYTGYVSAVNFADFSAGTEVETDAEYRVSFAKAQTITATNTAESVRTSLLNLEAVTDVIVYENPTDNYVYDRYDFLVCNPYTNNIVVMGGTDEDIAEVISIKSPLGVQLFGDSSYTYKNRLYRFTRATNFDFQIKIQYSLKDNSTLSEVDIRNMQNVFIDLTNSLFIGDQLLSEQYKSAAYSVVPYQKIKSLSVVLKDINTSGTSFVDILNIPYKAKARATLNNIIFERIPA